MKHDPIELELFRHMLVATAGEMGIVLRRTSYSVNIKERRDYSCAVYDAAGETIAMGDHMPVHLGAMPLSVKAVRDVITLEPGDVALVNDPFQGGTHLPDITAVSGVFLGNSGKAAFYLANRAHHSDVGGMSPGSMPLAREIYQEGLRLPPILLVKGGKTDQRMLAMILANVRTPEERRGDLLAQLMSIKRGEERLREMVARYGLPRVRRNMDALKDYSERMMRAELARLPRGVFRFEDSLDGADLKIRVAITIGPRGAKVDFTGTSPQADGPVNANYAIAVSAAMYVFRCLIREDVPYNAGLLRPIEIIAPEGTLVNAKAPAAMAAGNVETSQRITDTLLGALSKAAPARIPAASSGTMNNISFGGWDSKRNRPFAYYETIAGGMGAFAAGDGWSAVHTHMTNSSNTPVEAFEQAYPLRIEQYRVREHSGGKGKHRGGDGIRRSYEFLEPAEVTILADRRENGPYGLAGGEQGQPGKNILKSKSGRRALPGRVKFLVKAGDVVEMESPGGGGYGII